MFPAIIRFATEVHELMMSQRRNLRGPDVWGQNDENMTKPPKKTHRYLADPSWWFFDVFFSWCFVSTYIFSSPFGFDMLWEWCQMLWILGLKGTYCNMHTKRSSLQTIREFTMVCQVPSCRLHHNCSCSYCRILCIYMFHKMFHKMFQVFGSIRFNMFQHVSTCFDTDPVRFTFLVNSSSWCAVMSASEAGYLNAPRTSQPEMPEPHHQVTQSVTSWWFMLVSRLRHLTHLTYLTFFPQEI